MKAILRTFEQGPCDCCGPDVDESEWSSLYEAMHAAEKTEGKELDWQEVVKNAEYRADTDRWWRSYEVEPVEPVEPDSDAV